MNKERYAEMLEAALLDDVKYKPKPTQAKKTVEEEEIKLREVLGDRPRDMEPGTIIWVDDRGKFGFAESGTGTILEATELPKAPTKPGVDSAYHRVREGLELVELTTDLFAALRENNITEADGLRAKIKPLLEAYQKKWKTEKQNPTGSPGTDPTLWRYLNGGPASAPYPFADPRVWKLAALTDSNGIPSSIFTENNVYLPPPTHREYNPEDLVDTAKFVYEYMGEADWGEIARRYTGGTDLNGPLIDHEDFSIEALENNAPIIQINDEYLFGDIHPKIDQTVQMLDQIRAEHPEGPQKEKILDALNKQLVKLNDALPEQADAMEIVKRSDPFSAYIEDRSVKEWLGAYASWIYSAEKTFDEEKARWKWELKGYEGSVGHIEVDQDVEYKDELGIDRIRSQKVDKEFDTEFLEDYLNHKRPTKEVPTGRTDARGRPTHKTIYDQQGERVYAALSEKFREWGQQNLGSFETVVPRYNRAYRSFRERFYSDRQLDIPGLSAIFKGRPLEIGLHQWQGVGRMAHQGSGIISYAVGGGKTLTAVLLAAHLKNRGKIKKPLFVVPAKVIKNWGYEISQALPDARIIDLSGMDAKNRYRMLQRVAVSDADFILASFEGMKEIPLRKSGEYIQEDMRKIEDRLRAMQAKRKGRGDRQAQQNEKDLQNKLLRLEEKLTALQQMKRTKTMFFEDLGCDAVFIDEGHNYKNAPRDYGDMSEYVRESKSAERSADMQYKTRYIHERRGGRKGQNVWALTATPTPNHPAEIYVMMQYVAPDEWTNRGIENAGDFIEQFGRIDTKEVKGALGVPVAKTFWAGYKNLTELRSIFRRYIDFRTIDVLGIKRPNAEYIDIKLPPTEAITEAAGYIAWLEDYLKHDPVNAMMDGINHLSILTRARKLAADASIYDAEKYKDQVGMEGSKIHELVKLVQENDTGDNTQLIFLDLYRGGIYEADKPDISEGKVDSEGKDDLEREQESEHFVELVNLHQTIKDRFVASGIAEDQIAIVNGQNNNGAKAKFKIQQLNAEGKIRFLIGSRASMGEGMNLQTSTDAIYHIDVPFNYAALEQSDGRGLRQGNIKESVKIYRFLVSGTSDSKMYDLIARKYQWGLELWTGQADEVMDFDVDGRNFQELSDAAGINQDTLDYYRAKHSIGACKTAAAEIQAIMDKKESHRARVTEDVKWRQGRLELLEKEMATGQASDMVRRQYQSHKDNLAQLQLELEKVADEIAKLFLRKGELEFNSRQAVDYVALYEDSRRLDRPIEELAQERGIPFLPTGSRSFVANMEVKVRKAKPKPKKVPGLPTPPEDMTETPGEQPETGNDYDVPEIKVRSGWGDKAVNEISPARGHRGVYAAQREAEKGTAFIATFELKDVSMDLIKGRVPADVIEQVERHTGVMIDPLTAVVKTIPQGWTIDDQSHQYRLVTYPGGTVDVTEEQAWGRIEIPELMNLIVEKLTGNPILINRRLSSSLGRFVYGSTARVEIRPDLFKAENREQLARTLGHEIGHLADWLPDEIMNRGNLLGRLLTLKRIRTEHFEKVITGDKAFRKELIVLSEYWKPYNPKKETSGYIKYRKSSRELYADFVSALLNSPGTAQKFAPKFTREFHRFLERKPEFKEAYVKLRMMMTGTSEEHLDSRLDLLGGMIKTSEALSRAVEMEQSEPRRFRWGGAKDWFFDIHWEIEQRVNKMVKAGVKIPEEANPKFLWDEMNLRSHNDRWLFGDEVQKKVFEEILIPANITAEDIGYDRFTTMVEQDDDGTDHVIKNEEPYNTYMPLGIYMFLHRTATQRSNVANPVVAGGGYASETLDKLRERMGEEKFAALERAAHAYVDVFWPLVEKAFDLGIYPERARESFEENKYNYFKFVAAKHISKYVSPMVKAQIGFAGPVENPLISDIKMRLSLIDLIMIQEAKQATLKFMRNNYPEDKTHRAIAKVPTDVIKTWNYEKGFKVVEVLEDGKTVGWQMDPYIADAMNTMSPTSLANGLQWFNHLHETWWKIIILYNLGFGGWGNPSRDFWTNFKKLPLKNTLLFGDLIQLLKAYGKSFPHVRNWLAGKGDDMIKEMISNYEWGVSVVDAMSTENDAVHHLFKRIGLLKDTGEIEKTKAVQAYNSAMWVLNKIAYPSQFGELWGKAAGHIVRTEAGQTGKQMAIDMRRFTSTPAWYRQGTLSRYINRIYPFSTMILQGWVSEYGMATDPTTRGGYLLRSSKLMALKILTSLLAAGALKWLLGDELSEWYKDKYGKITNYMESNYLNIIFSETEDGRPIHFSLPMDEGTRMMSGILTTILRGHEIHDPETFLNVIKFVQTQMPSLSPFIQIPYAYWQFYGQGENPTDWKNMPVLPQDVAESGRGSWEAFKRLGLFSINQLGLGQYQTYDDSNKNPYEKWTQYDPLIGKWAGRIVRIGGYGEAERDRAMARIIKGVQKEKRFEKQRAGDFTRKFYAANLEVQRQALIVSDKADKGGDIDELFDQYPMAVYKKEFLAIGKILSRYEQQLYSLRTDPNIPSEEKDMLIEAKKKQMDETAERGVIRFNEAKEEMKKKTLKSLPRPPGAGLTPPPGP